MEWCEPEVPNDPDYIAASDRMIQFEIGWFAHPIFKDGDYPPQMREKVQILLVKFWIF